MAKTTGRNPGRPKSGTLKKLDPQGSQVAPPAPETLGVIGRAFWLAVFSNAHWLSPELDAYLIEQAAALADDIAEARAEIKTAGRYITNPNGSQQRSPAVVDLERLLISQNALLASLGLTPSDRARLGHAALAAESVMRDLEERRAARLAEQANRLRD